MARLAGEEEGLFVGFFEGVLVCGEEAAEGGDVGLLFCEGVGARFGGRGGCWLVCLCVKKIF